MKRLSIFSTICLLLFVVILMNQHGSAKSSSVSSKTNWRRARFRRKIRRKNFKGFLKGCKHVKPEENYVEPQDPKDGGRLSVSLRDIVNDTPKKGKWLGEIFAKKATGTFHEDCKPAVFKGIELVDSSKVRFNCRTSQLFCDCISKVSTENIGSQKYELKKGNKKIEVKFFNRKGNTFFIVSSDGHVIRYKNVNDKDRRRRLLQGGASGSAS